MQVLLLPNDFKKLAISTGLGLYAIIAFASSAYSPTIIPLERNLVLTNENTLISISPPFLSRQYILGSRIDSSINSRLISLVEKYSVSYEEMYFTLKGESGFNEKAIGDNGLAFGIAQFHRPTFDRFCEGNYYNTNDQLECMARLFSEGKEYHWSAWKTLYKGK